MDSLKHKARFGYTPNQLPEVENREVDPHFLQSSAPYMPLYDQELGDPVQVHPSYPVPEPPRISYRNQIQRVPVQRPVSEPQPTKESLEQLLKTSKRQMMRAVRSMRVIFLLKLIVVVLAGVWLVGEGPIGPGEFASLILLFTATILFGFNVRIGRKAAKQLRLRFIERKMKYVIINFCCYGILLVISSIIILDVIHFRAHGPPHMQPKPNHIQMGGNMGMPPHPALFERMPPSPPMDRVNSPMVLTINGQQTFPNFTPNHVFGEAVTIVFGQENPEFNDFSQAVRDVQILNFNNDQFVFEQAFGTQNSEIAQIDQELLNILALFENPMVNALPVNAVSEPAVVETPAMEPPVIETLNLVEEPAIEVEPPVESESVESETESVIDWLNSFLSTTKGDKGHRNLRGYNIEPQPPKHNWLPDYEEDAPRHKKHGRRDRKRHEDSQENKHEGKHEKKHGKGHGKKHNKHGKKHDRPEVMPEPQILIGEATRPMHPPSKFTVTLHTLYVTKFHTLVFRQKLLINHFYRTIKAHV